MLVCPCCIVPLCLVVYSVHIIICAAFFIKIIWDLTGCYLLSSERVMIAFGRQCEMQSLTDQTNKVSGFELTLGELQSLWGPPSKSLSFLVPSLSRSKPKVRDLCVCFYFLAWFGWYYFSSKSLSVDKDYSASLLLASTFEFGFHNEKMCSKCRT